jgi:regulation of enolase protein 1 (concanavalin A-like superfamily)
MQWYNEPPTWNHSNNIIQVKTGAKTDFWQKTHYGFIRDDGHFYYQQVTGNFQAEVKVTGDYSALYDQAGLMLRQDDKTWLKCGIEFVDGIQQASAVVTRNYSDWSVVPLPNNPTSIWLRLKRQAETVEVEYSLDGESYTMLRLAYLTEAETVLMGLMCAAPQGDGFQVTFKDFRIDRLPS